MPVEIEELVVRLVVTPTEAGDAPGRRKGGGDTQREDFVGEVVEQVLAILRQREER
jgi:hypothetical protein